jgi:hypothetical protein
VAVYFAVWRALRTQRQGYRHRGRRSRGRVGPG